MMLRISDDPELCLTFGDFFQLREIAYMLEINQTLLVVVDVQERLMPKIDRHDEIIPSITKLVAGCHLLDIPMLVTEQYPQGLGTTVAPVRTAMKQWYRPLAKTSFSACGDLHFMAQFETVGRQHAILCGVEGHICLYQTAMDLTQMGYEVEVAVDATGSRRDADCRVGLDKLTRHGIKMTTVEMALFEMMRDSDTEIFRQVAAIIK